MITPQKPHDRDWAPAAILHAAPATQEAPAAVPDDFAGVLQNLADEARTLIDAHYASIRIARDENWTQIISAISLSEKFASWSEVEKPADGFGDPFLFPIPRPLRLTSAEMLAHPAWKTLDRTAHQRPPMRGLLAAPLFDRQGGNFGLIDLTDKRQGDFSADDERRLVQLAKIAALAIENAALFRAADRENPMSPGVPAEFAAETPTGSQHAVITTNLADLIMDWSPGAEHLFGYPRRVALGQPIAMLIPPERLFEHQEAMEKVRRHETVSHPETVRLRQGGKRLDVSLTTSALHDPAGDLRGAVTVAHDIAAVKRLGQHYQQAQRMGVFGQLAGGVAHDFNNLLTVILGYSELLIARNHVGDSSRELLGEIHKAAGRAETLTRQLLAFSRKQTMEMKVIDLNTVVSDTEKMLRRLIGEDILMTTIFFPNLWSIEIDPGQMQQVILNLAVNARDAMPKGGRLTIETDNVTLDETYAQWHRQVRPGNYVRLCISDTGIGMNAAVKARIFEPLFTTKNPGKGTGLGLTTVKNIVQQSGGHIEVYSELGHGTTFKVYLPQVATSQPASQPSSGLHAIPHGNETVLLVEDEDSVRFLARRVLEACGYTVLEASNGEEALRTAEAYQGVIHLLVSDVVMPQLSGRSLADRLLLSKPNIRILFLSGYTSDTVVRHGVLEADFAFLQKPFTTSALAQKVRLVLD